jgi:hypothetical protein
MAATPSSRKPVLPLRLERLMEEVKPLVPVVQSVTVTVALPMVKTRCVPIST